MEDVIIKGLVFELGKINKNGRIYTKEAVVEQFFRMKDQIERGVTVLSEFGSPSSLSIDLDNTAALVHDLYVEGDNAYVELRILNTTNGQDLKKLICEEHGVVQINSRGTGTIDELGNVKDFDLYTFDVNICEEERFAAEIKVD